MNSTEKVVLVDVRRKISGQGNVYHELDFIHLVPVSDNPNENVQQKFNKVYAGNLTNAPEAHNLIGKVCEVTCNFYPITKKVGDKEFSEIKMNLVSISALPDKK
jgi:hypothetical protein